MQTRFPVSYVFCGLIQQKMHSNHGLVLIVSLVSPCLRRQRESSEDGSRPEDQSCRPDFPSQTYYVSPPLPHSATDALKPGLSNEDGSRPEDQSCRPDFPSQTYYVSPPLPHSATDALEPGLSSHRLGDYRQNKSRPDRVQCKSRLRGLANTMRGRLSGRVPDS